MSDALLREYRVCEEIGRGRFGAVSLCQPLDPTRPGSFAVKSICKASVSGDDLDSQCLLTEPKILSLLSPHPNIVQVNSPSRLSQAPIIFLTDMCPISSLEIASFWEIAWCSQASDRSRERGRRHRLIFIGQPYPFPISVFQIMEKTWKFRL